MKRVVTLLIVVPMYVLLTSNVLYSTRIKGNEVQEKALKEMQEWKFNYESTIWFIKQHEGFAGGKAYTCAAGYRTIGYGHVIKKGEYFPGGRISREDADILVRKDFDKALELCDMYTNLKGTKRLAIAHFIFAKGIGNFLRSTLRKKIEKGEPIEEEILKWCVYRKPDGTKVRSKYSYNIRLWELDMYYRDE